MLDELAGLFGLLQEVMESALKIVEPCHADLRDGDGESIDLTYLEEMLEKRQQRFKKHVFSILTDIIVAFRSCCKDKETEEATESALRMQLTINLGKARDIHERVLAKAMRDCKQC